MSLILGFLCARMYSRGGRPCSRRKRPAQMQVAEITAFRYGWRAAISFCPSPDPNRSQELLGTVLLLIRPAFAPCRICLHLGVYKLQVFVSAQLEALPILSLYNICQVSVPVHPSPRGGCCLRGCRKKSGVLFFLGSFDDPALADLQTVSR